jgi:hypothetical protein
MNDLSSDVITFFLRHHEGLCSVVISAVRLPRHYVPRNDTKQHIKAKHGRCS